jgi:hypothetical protein
MAPTMKHCMIFQLLWVEEGVMIAHKGCHSNDSVVETKCS